MIAVIETAAEAESHEMFNAGMLYQLHNVYPNEEIIYFCDKEHAKFVKRVLDIHDCRKNIRYSYIKRNYVTYSKQDVKENKEEYINIFRKCSKAKFVMILSTYAVSTGLLKNLMKKFYYLKFGICIHGNVEYILPQNTIKFKMNYRIIDAIKEYWGKRKELEYFMKNLHEMAMLSNCNIILYSDNYKEYKDDISPMLYQNIKVLNLPYPFTYNKKIPVENKIFKIGIMPSSAAAKDHNCIKIIKYMNEQKNRIKYPYRFVILNHDIGLYENVVYVRKPSRTRKDIEDFMEACNWMLIPYDENKYILSSSGVMFDAIEAERPFFVLGSPSFYKAIDAGCGIQETFIEALGERIIQQINNGNSDYEQYHENIRNYKKRVEKENVERILKIFGQ